MRTTAFITHRDCWQHQMGSHHPECPQRLDAICDRLQAVQISPLLDHREAPLASESNVLRVHDAQYVSALQQSAPQQGMRMLDADTIMCPQTLHAAYRAAGAGILAVDLVMERSVHNAFCAVRPPGHHAERDRAMGFCFFNNVAVAAAHALEVHGLERVAIADFDVHHGNGTEHVFAGDPRVLMVGTFQHPFYPFSGTENPAENMANVPLAAGTRGDGFREAVTRVWVPRLRAFRPQLLLISAGFDAHIDDDMASLGLVENDYVWVTEVLLEVAREFSSDRIVSMLEGGYDFRSLSRSAEAHIKALADL